MVSVLYFEDLTVGRKFGSGTMRVERDRIVEFAAEFDPQPFHLDEEAARASLFGGLAASGWHTAAMAMRLLVASAFRPAGGIIGGGGELAWPHPVRPGDTLRVETEVLEARNSRSRPDQGVVKIRVTTFNQAGETVQTFAPTLLVARRAAAPGAMSRAP